jgi:hypothetical protein
MYRDATEANSIGYIGELSLSLRMYRDAFGRLS